MTGQSRLNLTLAAICLVGAVLLGLAVWAVGEEDDEPTAQILAVADLAAPSAEGSEASGRIEVVQTGERSWIKVQVRDLPDGSGALVAVLDGSDAAEPVLVPIDGDGDYTLPQGIAPTVGTATIVRAETALLVGRIDPAD